MSEVQAPRYRRSSYCAAGDCVEVALLPGSSDVVVRDAKYPAVSPHRFTAAEWDAFLDGVKAGEFDRKAL